MTETIINDSMPDNMINALAIALGFRIVLYADSCDLSIGHGTSHTTYTGTKRSVAAFLLGYGAMQLQTSQMLNDLDNAHRRLIIDMRARMGA